MGQNVLNPYYAQTVSNMKPMSEQVTGLPSTGVKASIATLSDRILQLELIVEQLVDKMSYVVVPTPGGVDGGANSIATPTPHSPITSDIDSLAGRADLVAKQLKALLSTIDY